MFFRDSIPFQRCVLLLFVLLMFTAVHISCFPLCAMALDIIILFHPVSFIRQLVRTADGGTLSLDVYPPFDPSSPSDASIPMLFVLHGLTGTTQESYTRATVKELCMRNPDPTREWRVVAMNFRGCDVDTPVTSPRLYHVRFPFVYRCCFRSVR